MPQIINHDSPPNLSQQPPLDSTPKKSRLNLLFPLILFGIWLIIAIPNFPKNEFLSGWDNLHPEFNITQSIKRAVFGVWQEHQGLGHVGGHGYASVLTHTLMIAFLRIFFSINLVRASFTLLTLLVGSMGCYFLVDLLLNKKDPYIRYTSALLGAVFYMVNFATIQQFYIQLEAFIIHFAVLPWLLYLTLSLLNSWPRKKVLLFALVSFIGSTQGFIPPLFVIYFLSLSSILLFYFASHRSVDAFKKVFLIGLITFCVNSYWLLPALHYTATGSGAFLNSTNNRLSTQGWVDTNDTYGTLAQLSILRGFPSQAIDEQTTAGTRYIFQPWLDHLNIPFISGIGIVLFVIICLGIIVFIKNQKPRYHLSFVLIFILLFSLLATQIPILSHVSELIQQLPLFKQAFRAGFTKVSIAFALYYAVFFSYGACFIIELFQNIFKKIGHSIIFSTLSGGIMLVSVLCFSFPVFQGHLFYEKAKISIPNAYFELFSFFDNQKTTDKIALLPQGTHWGWDTYQWGYTGSGFLWFGLPQPILERAFDVWSNVSENYYWELTQALYSSNSNQLRNIVNKYQIKWVIVDESFIPFYGTKSPISADKTLALVSSSSEFELIKKIPILNGGKYIYIFKTHLDTSDKTDVAIYNNIATTTQPFSWTTRDMLYEKTQGYFTEVNATQNSINFPFGSLFSSRDQNELSFNVEENNDSFTFSTQINKNNSLLSIPPYPQNDLNLEPILVQDNLQYATPSYFLNINQQEVEINNSASQSSFLALQGNEETVAVTVPKLPYYSSYDSDNPRDTQPNIAQCSETNKNALVKFSSQEESGKKYTNFENSISSTCYDIFLSNVSQKYGYLLLVESKNIKGNPLLFTLINGQTRRNDIETYLPAKNELNYSSIVIPPKAQDSIGYSLRFSNIAISQRQSINNLGRIILYPIPYDFITSIKTSSNELTSPSTTISTSSFNVSHPNSSLYQVVMSHDGSIEKKGYVISLNQGFDVGWKAYETSNDGWMQTNFPSLFGTEIKNHVLINNWANGWRVDSLKLKAESQKLNTQIVIVFWPQYLEYLGFGILLLTSVVILLQKEKTD